MSPVGDKVNPNPGDVVHHITRVVSRLEMPGAVVEVNDVGGDFQITVSAPDTARLAFACARLEAEFRILARQVREGKHQ